MSKRSKSQYKPLLSDQKEKEKEKKEKEKKETKLKKAVSKATSTAVKKADKERVSAAKKADKEASKLPYDGASILKMANETKVVKASSHASELDKARRDLAASRGKSTAKLMSVAAFERIGEARTKFKPEHMVPSYKIKHSRGSVHVTRETKREGDEGKMVTRTKAYHRFETK